MYEITVSVAKQKKAWLGCETELEAKVRQCGGVFAKSSRAERIYLSFACDESNKRQLLDIVLAYIVDAYVVGAKREYIKSRIKMAHSQIYDIFLNVLIRFDSESEREIIVPLLSLRDNFSIDGYFYFRLSPLRARWDEICMLARENAAFLHNNETMYELLRFLLSTLKPKADCVEVHKDGDGYLIKADCDGESTRVVSVDGLFEYFINTAPLKITVVGDILPENASALLSNIFMLQ